MVIKSPSQKNHLPAGAKLFVAFGEEGDRGGVGVGGVRLGRGNHAVLVAHQEQRALELCGNVRARDRDALGLGQLLDERRRAAADVSASGSYSPTVMAALPLTSITSMSTPSRAV